MEDHPKPSVSVAAIFLGVLAMLLLAVAVVGYFGDEEEPITGGLILAGVVLAALAAFERRIQGTLKISKDGAEIPIGEYQAQKGQIVPAPRIEISGGDHTLTADEVEPASDRQGESTATHETTQPNERRTVTEDLSTIPRVFFTAQAADQYDRLNFAERVATDAALQTLGTTPDPKFITTANAGGRAYSRRRLKDQGLQLIYRSIDKISPDEPDRFVVIAIEDSDN